MNHVLKYVHGVETLEYDIPVEGTYWAHRKTCGAARVVDFEEADQGSFSQSVVSLELVDSDFGLRLTLEELKARYVHISTPPSEKPFAWIRKFFDKRQILSVREVEQLPESKLQHLYVMNGLSVSSFMKHHTHTKIPFPIPKLSIPIRENPDSQYPTSSVDVWESWVPVDLLEQYAPSTLFASAEFRAAVAKGHLYILSNKYARHILATQEAHVEMHRLLEIERFVESRGLRNTLNADTETRAILDAEPPHYADLKVDNNASTIRIVSKRAQFSCDGGWE